MVKQYLLIPFLVSIFWGYRTHEVKIPDTVVFCGLELKLEEGAKEQIRKTSKKLLENPTYFNAAVARGNTYLPFVEEALADLKLPDDLKYVAMQESNLIASAVSTSNAVGFWQFKETAARESGLRVDEYIDERKHIYLSSLAAGSYIAKSNRVFDNWIYAIISYYEGVTGVIAYTDPQYYGQKQMIVNEKTHWYLLKTIAYKLAYENALKLAYQPALWLEPVSVTGPLTTAELAAKFKKPEETILEHNKWLSQKTIPEGTTCTVYIPHLNEVYKGHIQDPNKIKALTNLVTIRKEIPIEVPVTVSPDPIPSNKNPFNPAAKPVIDEKPTLSGGASSHKEMDKNDYVELELTQDLYYGKDAMLAGVKPEYILYDGSQKIRDIALDLGLKYTDLLLWNDTDLGEEPLVGTVVYLKKPSRSRFHIVRKGETLGQIADMHNMGVWAIQKRNGMSKTMYKIYVGQKLYLKDTKPKNEKIIILTHPYVTAQLDLPKEAYVRNQNLPAPVEAEFSLPRSAQTVAKTVVRQEVTTKEVIVRPAGQKSQWVEHKVQAGETLWTIAQKYGTRVELIRKINELSSDALAPDRLLKIFMTMPDIPVEDQKNGLTHHLVMGGDVLSRIAQRYGTHPDTLAKVNQLDSMPLRAGQLLKIPVKTL